MGLTHFSYPLMQISPHFIEKTPYLCSQNVRNTNFKNKTNNETKTNLFSNDASGDSHSYGG